jgi:hypothetical protein
MSLPRFLRLAALGAAAAATVACADDPTGPRLPAAGTFRFALTGDHVAQHTGEAVFGVDGPQGNRVFGLILGADETDMANIAILRRGAERLEVGDHQIANTSDGVPDAAGAVEVLVGVGNDTSSVIGFFDGKSGTIRITRSTPALLAGTFTVVAEGLLERDGGTAEPATVEVTGAFTAEAAGAGAAARGMRIRTQDVRVRPLGR